MLRTTMTQPTRPVLGYLTTLWTPPASCFSVRVYETNPPWSEGYQAQTCGSAGMFVLSDAPDCWPPRTANAPHPPTSTFLRGWGFYSPGTLCPHGFTTACVATYGEIISDWSLQFPLTAGETAAGCCPSGGYKCSYLVPDSDYGQSYEPAQTCRLLATSTTIAIAPCAPITTGDATVSAVLPYTLRDTDVSFTRTSTFDSFAAWAPLIQINWQIEDLTTSTPTSANSSWTTTRTGQSGALSNGAIAGIAIASVSALTITAVGIFLFAKRRRETCKKVIGQSQEQDGVSCQQHRQSVKSQLEVPQLLELPTTDVIQELPGAEVTRQGLRAEGQS